MLYGWLVVYPNGNVQGSLDMYHPDTVLEKRIFASLKCDLERLNGRGPPEKEPNLPNSLWRKQ